MHFAHLHITILPLWRCVVLAFPALIHIASSVLMRHGASYHQRCVRACSVTNRDDSLSSASMHTVIFTSSFTQLHIAQHMNMHYHKYALYCIPCESTLFHTESDLANLVCDFAQGQRCEKELVSSSQVLWGLAALHKCQLALNTHPLFSSTPVRHGQVIMTG